MMPQENIDEGTPEEDKRVPEQKIYDALKENDDEKDIMNAKAGHKIISDIER